MGKSHMNAALFRGLYATSSEPAYGTTRIQQNRMKTAPWRSRLGNGSGA